MLYLAYGSNMAPPRIEARLGACVFIGIGWLEETRIAFHKRGRDGSGKCNAHLTGNPEDRLYGVLFGLSEAQGRTLDGFEGPGYYRRVMPVRTDAGVRFAYTYVAKDAHVTDGLIPYDWYKAFVVSGASEAGLPVGYQTKLAKVPANVDPDESRRSINFDILARESVDAST
ncbi:MAG: gamma-glutamylcyclotransferase family protein [Pseudomonadota bacterium]